jgi:hypothetical protein
MSIFSSMKGFKFLSDMRDSEGYSKQHYQAVAQSLDDFLARVSDVDNGGRNLYL